MVLVIWLFNMVDVLFGLLYFIVVEDKEASRDDNDLLFMKEIEL
jgi:hypothetical protein